jgi:hypothetical protein
VRRSLIDPTILENWTSEDPRVGLKGRPFGVCALKPPGEIMVNYVSPDRRFRGCHQGMLRQAELEASDLGTKNVILQSSLTAFRFFKSMMG